MYNVYYRQININPVFTFGSIYGTSHKNIFGMGINSTYFVRIQFVELIDPDFK